MNWNLTSDRPIYAQLMEQIIRRIVSGEFNVGEKLPSVRDLAQDAAVNPNTMQKALSELERTGLVYTQRTSGRFITQDGNLIEEMKANLAKEQITDFLEQMNQLGFNKEQIMDLLKNIDRR